MLPTEAQEQDTLVAWLRVRGLKFHHSPNATGHTPEQKRRAIQMKRAGTSKGFPDLLIIINGHMVFIELKRQKGGTVSPEQKDWIEAINTVRNCEAIIARGAQEAIEYLERLLPPVKEQFESLPF